MDENDCVMNKKTDEIRNAKRAKRLCKVITFLLPSSFIVVVCARVISFCWNNNSSSFLYLLLFISRTEACLALSIKDHWMFPCAYWLHRKDTNESFKVNESYEKYSWLSNYMLRSLKEHSIVILIFSSDIIECYLMIMQMTVLFRLNKGYFAFNGQQKVCII